MHRPSTRRKIAKETSLEAALPAGALTNGDAIVTPNEANSRHGIGIIVERFFGQYRQTLSIRSQDTFGGEQTFGSHRLLVSHAGLVRSQSYEALLRRLNENTIQRILCIPFFSDDLITAICLKELFNAPLCIYVMDDNNIAAHGISDELFAEALGKARLRLAISAEIRDAYEAKFQQPFAVLPPLVVRENILTEPTPGEAVSTEKRPGALVGNIWSQKWLELLRGALRGSGVKLDWYGNTGANWLHYTKDELAADGIRTIGFLPEEELIERLRGHPYAVIPYGSLDEHDDRPELARLSLPSRISYLAAVANLPLIVLGHRDTAASHFVQRFQLGLVCPYDSGALREAARQISTPAVQERCRRNASEHGAAFSLEQPGEWIWNSLAKGAPIDDRFEKLLPRSK